MWPQMEDKERIELAGKFLEEARGYVAKRDPIQASEKLYKAAEESLKALAYKLDLEAARTAEDKGKWTTSLLFDAAAAIAEKFGESILHWWDSAWVLHIEGFHEARLGTEHVKVRIKDIDNLVSLAKKYNVA